MKVLPNLSANPFVHKLKLLLTILVMGFVLGSCTFSGYSARYLSNDAKQSRPVVFSANFEKALYKTELQVYGRTMTGITVIKQDSLGFHVALVSEVGLKYYEFFFPKNADTPPRMDYMMEVMNHTPVVEGLKAGLGLLFREPVYDKHARIQMNETGKTCLLFNKDKKGTTKYYFNWISGEVERLIQNKLFKTKTEIKLADYQEGEPGSILLHRGKISMQMRHM